MSESMEKQVRRRIRSPRSAAIAGIAYTLLTVAIMVLMYSALAASPDGLSAEWLESWSTQAHLVLMLVPFAGITFLWFTGVIRDLLGDLEDRFFATVFLGSGIILVTLMYVWAAAIGAIFATFALAADVLADFDVFIYGTVFANEIVGSLSRRMEALYMLSIASLWLRTKVVPKWLSILTFIVGVPVLLFGDFLQPLRFFFSPWVLLVSITILVINYRHRRQHDGEDLSLDAE